MPARPGAPRRRGALDRRPQAQLGAAPRPLRGLRRRAPVMTDDLRYERIVTAPPEDVFAAFTSTGCQIAFYGQDDPGWIVRSESEVRIGGAWTVAFGPAPERRYRHRHRVEV